MWFFLIDSEHPGEVIALQHASEQKISAPRLDSAAGALMVETAFSIGLFFLLILSGVELMRLGYNVMCAQYAVSAQIRQAILGPTDAAQAAMTSAQRGDFIEDQVILRAQSLGISLGGTAGNNPNVTVCSIRATCVPDDAGSENVPLYIEVNYPLKLFFGLATYNVKAIAIGRNEPFNSL